MKEFWAICYLFSPMLVGLTVHGFSIRLKWGEFLVRPIDGGRKLGGKRLFGENKTYRGVVMMALGTALGFLIQVFLHRYEAFRQLELIDYSIFKVILLGLAIGTAAMLSELVNSFIKRQLDIAPGKTTDGILSLFFHIFDQIDYLLGVWLVLGFYVEITFQRVIFSAVFIFFSHQIISVLGYWLGMRKTIR